MTGTIKKGTLAVHRDHDDGVGERNLKENHGI